MKNIIYIVCLVFLFSCSKESDLGGYEGEKVSIVLKLTQNSGSAKSRATEPGDDSYNETKINGLHVFFFLQNTSDSEVCSHRESYTGLTFQGAGIFSKELTAIRDLFTQNAVYDVYVVANLPSNVIIAEPVTRSVLKSLRSVTPLASYEAQPNFIMDGKTSVVINPSQFTPVVNANVSLKRAISKVRVRFTFAPGAAVGTAFNAVVTPRHYVRYTSVLDNNPISLVASDYIDSFDNWGLANMPFIFYCYENNWGTNSVHETFMKVNIPYGTNYYNYYRIPINPYANCDKTGRIERNMIYDITAYIEGDGSTDPSGVVVNSANYTITNWATNEIVLRTINQNYLGISEYNIVMPNISTYTIKYVSDLPISITGVTASCTQYSAAGVPSTVTYLPGQPQFPIFTVNPATSTITISSAIPINYVPKNMTFTVTNNLGLNLNATIVQYPTRYVTARLSRGNIKPEWLPGGTNFNLFTVNTLVPSQDGSYTLGDPTNGMVKTDSTAAGNKMVSPRFIIASQYGVYSRANYTLAQQRCLLYGEDIYRSGWRMPTKAEIELVNAIQDDPNSAVKALLLGDAYWSAYKFDYYDFFNNTWTNSNVGGTAFVRAVYDIYKDEQ